MANSPQAEPKQRAPRTQRSDRRPTAKSVVAAAKAPYVGALLGSAAGISLAGLHVSLGTHQPTPAAEAALGAAALALIIPCLSRARRAAPTFLRALRLAPPGGNAARGALAAALYLVAAAAIPAAWTLPLAHPRVAVAALAGPLAIALLARAAAPTRRRRPADWIGRDTVVGALASAVMDNANPVVALVGPLGSGKSWVLDALGEKLEKDPRRPTVVRFNAWLPADGEAMATALANSIAAALQAHYWIPWAGTRARWRSSAQRRVSARCSPAFFPAPPSQRR